MNILDEIIKHGQVTDQDEILIVCKEVNKEAKGLIENFKYLTEDIKKNHLANYRVGSRWDMNSKLSFNADWPSEEIAPGFNPNFDPGDRESEEHDEAVGAGKLFKEKSLEYLSGQD